MFHFLLFLLTESAVVGRRALVVIDMTVGQWNGVSYRANTTLATVQKLMANSSEAPFDLIIDSHLAMACTPPEQGTICEIEWPRGKSATALLPVLRFPHVNYVAKESYSSFFGSTLDATLRAAGISIIYLAGINTDYCVFATALSAWERAYEVNVVLDAVTSVGGATGHADGLKMFHKFFIDYSSTQRVKLIQSADIPKRVHALTSPGGVYLDVGEPEAWTLDGQPLYPPAFKGLTLDGLDAQLAIARDALRTPPRDDPAKHVWLGRRLAYKWRYRESLEAYSAALADFPHDAHLHRHRGHRYVTTRNFTRAERDLAIAARLINGTADGWEPDGQPNQYNLPLSSRRFNVFYHLGLSRYLQADYAGAIEAYASLPSTGEYANDESLAAAAHWRYMALRRSGHAPGSAVVAEALANIQPGMRALDGGAYLQLCLLYKGLAPLPDLSNASGLELATLGYGVGHYHFYNGRHSEAIAVWKHVVQGSAYWAAFGFVAAEAELHHLGVALPPPLLPSRWRPSNPDVLGAHDSSPFVAAAAHAA